MPPNAAFALTESPPDPEVLLKSVFGHDRFRGQQRAIIERVIGGGDAIVLMPTGGGKSATYQLAALCRPGLGIVVSPLIALMRDQVEALRQAGVRAAAFNSSISQDEYRETMRAIDSGTLDLLYVAPERLLMDGFLTMLDRIRLSVFAIDEAHCVSQWGHDFRKEYTGLGILADRYPGVPRMALTATADSETRADIRKHLRLENAREFVDSFDRPNIRYAIVPKIEPKQQLLAFVKARPGQSGIVYAMSRARVDETAEWLRGHGVQALAYHAGMTPPIRQKHQDAFLRQEGLVLVATIAFGMGIDKPDVRFVAHLDLPSSVEAYYQETGRAGRDGLHADAWLAYGSGDVVFRRRMIDESAAPDAVKRVERGKLEALLGICETVDCRRNALLSYFGEARAEPCGNCDSCLAPVETWDGTLAARKAVSAAMRVGQRFGAGHLIDILRGVETEKTARFDHHNLPTFGVGKDLSQKEWQSAFRQLIAIGVFDVDHNQFGALKPTELGRAVMRGERPVRLRRDMAAATKAALKKLTAKTPSGPPMELNAAGAALYEALKAERSRLAKEQAVPAYVVFHDSTLADMAARKPRTPDDLALISGVGQRKIEKYGAAFLAVVREHG
jgi:ATP-dependent DNA helicase RecQ